MTLQEILYQKYKRGKSAVKLTNIKVNFPEKS